MKKIISVILTLMILTSCLPVALAAGAYDENGKYVYRNNTFQFELIQEDPQHITDEDFFGVWNEETGQWVVESYFKYGHEDFPGLAPVEEAAKQGDYAAAKKALMDYYLPQKYDKVTKNPSVGDSDYYEVEFQGRNMYASSTQGTPLAVTDWVYDDWTEITVNSNIFLSGVNSRAKGDGYFTAVIASMDKSNTPAEIKSRDTDAPPVLTLVVNKVQKQYYPEADSYISPALNANVNYGSEKYLLAQEYGYRGHWSDEENPWDEEASETKRTYIRFDLSDIKSTDAISSASLTFTARTAAGGDLDKKELMIYGWNHNDWKEDTLVWNSFTDWKFFSCNEQETWDFVTSEETTKKGKICYFHRGAKLQAVAEPFEYSKDERYAYTFLRELMSTATYVSSYEKLPHVMNHLDTANHVYGVGNCWMHCWDSKYMTPEIFTACLKHFYIITDVAHQKWGIPIFTGANGATNQVRMTFWFATAFPEMIKSDEWYQLTVDSCKNIFENGHFEDGVCIEQGMGYIQTFMGNISTLHNSLFKLRGDSGYYGPYTDLEGAEHLRQIMIASLASTSYNYGEFNLGDSSTGSYGGGYESWFAMWYKILLELGIDDPNLQYVATKGAKGQWFDFSSNSFPYGLRTYMRSGWGKNDIMLAFNNKGNNESHGHRDQLHLVLHGYGNKLLVDSYGSNLIGDVRKQEVSASQHNTITVNGGNHSNREKGKDGKEKEQEINDIFNYTTYSSEWIDGAKYAERNVLFLKNQGFFIVSDFVEVKDKTRDNKITQFWHMQPDAYISISDKNEFRSNFATGGNIIVSPVGADSMSNIYLADSMHGPKAGTYIETKKGVYERTTSDTAKYGTILYPMQQADDRKITTDEIDIGITNNGASAFRVIIENPKTGVIDTYYYYHISDLEQKKDITIGDYKTDATSFVVQEDMTGKAVSFFIYEGTYVEKYGIKDKYLFKSTMDIPVTVGVNASAGTVAEISTNFEDDKPTGTDFDQLTVEEKEQKLLDNITAYVGHSVKSASFNGDIIGSTKSGAYVYFSDTPIVECTEEYVDPETNGPVNDTIFDNFGGAGSGGGGGLGSGNVGDTTKPSEGEENKGEETIKPEDKPVTPAPSYGDVSKNDWYYDYVTELTEKEIVSGDGTGNFAPNSNVTREQFLKMLIIAANVETNEAENTFDDVADNAWYKEYVLTAKAMGIVNGVSNTKFGIGSNITRQDMAVMISRIIEKLGIKLEEEDTAKFVDDAKVAEYAKESVTFMKSIGLIEGYNNEFRPTDTLTRAESAKVISGLLELIKTAE